MKSSYLEAVNGQIYKEAANLIACILKIYFNFLTPPLAALNGHPDTAMVLFKKGVPLLMPNRVNISMTIMGLIMVIHEN